MEKLTRTADNILQKIALPVIAIAGIMLITAFVVSTKNTGEQNNAYIRVINCIVSYPATSRTQDDVEQCYKTVESELGVTLQRYDSSNQ